MKKIKKLLALAILLFVANASGQESILEKYTWDTKAPKIEIPQKYINENEVILDKTIKVELVNYKDGSKQFYLYDQKIYLNSDDAINKYNKIYIPFANNEKLLLTKARVILKNGKVITVKTDDIKEEVDEEKGVKYNYFAVTGLEKGAVLEQMFLFEQEPDLNGKTLKMQGETPIANLNFQLIYPDHLVFKTKSYNGLSEAIIDKETYKDKKKFILSIQEKDIPALLNDDKYSNWNTSIKMFRYKLDENLISGAKNLYNYKTFSNNVYTNLYGELDKKNLKAIDDFAKTISTNSDLQANIWSIENKVKKTIVYSSYFDSKANLSEVIKSKQANQADMIKLYIALFTNQKIEHNLVFTSDRFEIPFDKDFESYENLNEILFYFPTIDKYLAPTEAAYRIPLFPHGYGGNNGMFIKTKEYSGVKMAYADVNLIKIPDTSVTHDVMDITVDFTNDLQNPLITTKVQFGGYSNINLQPIKDFVPADQYKTILQDIAENYTGSKDFKKLETKNDGLDYIGKEPFILEVSFEGKELMQKAGTNYLFSVGKTIGNQAELYQEGTRKTEVEIEYPHAYKRTIKIILPDNVTVKNTEKFTMDFETKINDKAEAGFISKFSKKDNTIIVENSEFYNSIKYPLDKFESYKNVINAAADFNKIVLILTKN